MENNRKKVLFVRTPPYDLDPNSYNVQQIGLGKAICDRGYDFDFITFKKKDQREFVFYESNGCRAKWIEKPRVRLFRTSINFSICNRRFLEQYDVIISQEYNQLMTYMLSKKSKNVVMYNGPYYNMFMVPFFSKIYDILFTRKIDKQIRYKFVKSILAEKYLRDKGYSNVYNVGVGLDTERFNKEEQIKPETQALIEYMNSHKCILYVGALSDRKNYPFMLEVYKKILLEEPDIKFVVIGKSRQSVMARMLGKKDESYEKGCIEKLPSNILDGIYRVERIDNPQLKYIYPLTKAFLLPSKLEIFGMVLLEAMYFGAPVITSKNGGSLTLIGDGKTGQIIEDFDSDKWAKAILNYINNTDYANEVSKNAHDRVKNEYNWTEIANKILGIIGLD